VKGPLAGEERSVKCSSMKRAEEGPEKGKYVGQLNQEGQSYFSSEMAFFCSFRI